MVGPLVALVALEEGRERFGPNTDPMRRDGVGAVDDVVARRLLGDGAAEAGDGLDNPLAGLDCTERGEEDRLMEEKERSCGTDGDGVEDIDQLFDLVSFP